MTHPRSAVVSARGAVVSVSSSERHGFSKTVREAIHLIAGHGVEGDVHAGPFVKHRYLARCRPRSPNNRQVHLLESEVLNVCADEGFVVGPGDLGENIITRGIDLRHLPLGTRLYLGPTAIVELRGLRKPCVQIEQFRTGLLALTIDKNGSPRFRIGVMGVVRHTGWLRSGDVARAEIPVAPFLDLPPI